MNVSTVNPAISIIAGILYYVVFVYVLVIWARFVADLVLAVKPQWRPGRGLVIVLELVYTLTDPPLKLFRRLIPPIRVGNAALDFGLLLTLLSCSILMNVLAILR